MFGKLVFWETDDGWIGETNLDKKYFEKSLRRGVKLIRFGDEKCSKRTYSNS